MPSLLLNKGLYCKYDMMAFFQQIFNPESVHLHD